MIMTDLETWMHDYSDELYHVFKYQKVYTPREIEAKYSDESRYEWDKICKFEEVIELQNDVLFGLQEFYEDFDYDENNEGFSVWKKLGPVFYVRLSDIYFTQYEIKD